MRPRWWTPHKWTKREVVAMGFMEMAEGFLCIVSLSHIRPGWSYLQICRMSERVVKERIKEAQHV